MGNVIKTMQKVPDQAELRQRELQKQSIIVNTRFQLSSTYLNTLAGRADVDITDPETVSGLVNLSVDLANGLMAKLGMIMPVKTDD